MIAPFLISFIPIISFLIMLVYIDNYKLLRWKTIIKMIFWGALTAGICYIINVGMLSFIQLKTFTHFIAPFIEECGKAIIPIIMIKRGKIGFLVDGAIIGFAAGAGFAFLENLYYLMQITDSQTIFWIFRGFGTTIMHGGNTAIFTVITIYLIDKKGNNSLMRYVPGILVAITLHSLFNLIIISPLMNTLLQIIVLPVIFMFIFSFSEKGLKNWLQAGFDNDIKMLEFLKSGKFSESKQGKYLSSFKACFPGEIVLDLFCYLRVYLELSIRAKGLLMLKESGITSVNDPEISDKFSELAYLEKKYWKIGPESVKTTFEYFTKRIMANLFSGKPELIYEILIIIVV